MFKSISGLMLVWLCKLPLESADLWTAYGGHDDDDMTSSSWSKCLS